MTIPTRPLFLAGLLLAAACSDGGTPVDTEGRDPRSGEPAAVLGIVTCTVDETAGTFSCASALGGMGSALGAINISGGSGYVVMARSNEISTADSTSFDMTIQNVMSRQVMGTMDGVTPHPAGMRFFFYDPSTPASQHPKVLTKVNPALPASITVVTDSLPRVFSGAGSTPRYYFQYAPEILDPQDVSAPVRWRFAKQNVATWSFTGYVSTEVRFPRGWLDVTPDSPVVGLGDSDTLAAHVRGAFGQRHTEPQGLTWTSSDPSVVTVMELAAPDTLAQITAVAQGTAWVKAVSVAEPAQRRDSVLVTVN